MMILGTIHKYHGIPVLACEFLPDEWDEYFGYELINHSGWYSYGRLFIHPYWVSRIDEFLSQSKPPSNEEGEDSK